MTNTLQYDAESKAVWDSGTSYSYNPVGDRVGKAGSTAVDTVYFGGRPIARLSGGAWTDLIYGASGPLAEVPGTQNGAPVYRMTDHLGTEVGTIDASGNRLSVNDYAPFGQAISGGDGDPTNSPAKGLRRVRLLGNCQARTGRLVTLSWGPYGGR